MVKINSSQEIYNAVAPYYCEYSMKRQSYLDAIDNLVIEKLHKSTRLLDIGAGDGRRLAKFKEIIGLKDIVAVEPSKEMAKICGKRLNIDVHQSDGENIDQLQIGNFDVIIALWNVFGHLPDSSARLKALENIASKLKPNGIFILDINNRHNKLAYGWFNVLKRRIIDSIYFDEKRGNASYLWNIGDKIFQGSGHLFVPSEIEALFLKSNLKIAQRLSVNYQTGKVSVSKFNGQLFYILKL